MPFEQAEPRARRDWLKRVAGGGVLPAPRFPNLPVVTHEGRTVRFYDDLVRGRTVVFNMMYTVCTGICPISTANLLQVQQALGHRLGRDLFMYSLTLQPQFDDPRALRDYMQRYGIRQPGWTWTGCGARSGSSIPIRPWTATCAPTPAWCGRATTP
jgi:cytochrome oxidase Cu insertion factor (SCO1/SenC/PrrC family)